MIQNPGFSPPECYTVLGVSTTRNAGVDGTIGKFGSGSKHAVNLLLRHKLSPIIYCSNLRLEFCTEKQTVNDGLGITEFGGVFCKMSGKDLSGSQIKRTKDLGFVLEYGTYDWTELAMGLREFVSNAIDRTIREDGEFQEAIKSGRLCVKLVEDNQVRAKEGYTRVFVPLSPEVQRFYGELPRRFLHFSSPELLEQKILPKGGRNLSTGRGAMIYKRGVFVREVVDQGHPSLFDYNLNDLDLDESRNVDDYVVRTHAAYALRDADANILATVFKSLTAMEQIWEATFNKYDLSPSWDSTAKKEKRKETWKAAWKQAVGEGILCGDSQFEAEMVSKKGYEAKVIKATSWVTAAEDHEVNSSVSIMSAFEKEGREIIPATPDATKAVDAVWSWLEKHSFTFNKTKPYVKCFRDKMEGGGRVLGYYSPGSDTVMINEQHASDGQNKMLLKTALEEITHYVTNATDMSRDMQDFILRLVVEQNV